MSWLYLKTYMDNCMGSGPLLPVCETRRLRPQGHITSDISSCFVMCLLSAVHRRLSALPMERPPAVVGQGVDEVDTPALLLDLDALERNCNSLKARLRHLPNVTVRPHAKVNTPHCMP